MVMSLMCMRLVRQRASTLLAMGVPLFAAVTAVAERHGGRQTEASVAMLVRRLLRAVQLRVLAVAIAVVRYSAR
jgi:hypothetical protein